MSFKLKKSIALFTMIVLSLMLVTGCGQDSSQTAVDADLIKIGLIGPLTGDTVTYGVSTKNGVEVAIDEFNENGGIDGKNIELIAEDTRGDQSEAASAASKLIQQDNVVGIVGGVISPETMTAGPIANDSKVVMISSSSTAAGVPDIGEFIFRNCLSDEVQAVQLAEYAINELGYKKFAIMYTNNDYGLSVKDAFEEKARELSEVVAVETFNDGENDFRAQLTKIKGKSPDAIYIAGYYTEAAKIAQQAQDQELNAAILGADGFYSPKLMELGGDAVENVIFTAGFFTDDPQANVQNFVKAYNEKFNEDPDMFAAQAYDATKILLEAIKNANSLAGEDIRSAMAQTKNFPGVTGTTSFTENGDAVKDILILRVKDGKFVKQR